MEKLSYYTAIIERELTPTEKELAKLMGNDNTYIAYKDSNGNLAFMAASELTKVKAKADKWDALNEEIEKCYEEDSGADLITIGEIAAIHFGCL